MRYETAKVALLVALALPTPAARADMFGGDDILLGEIVTNTLQQLAQLESLLQTGQDTFGYLQSINQGISQAAAMGQTMNKTLTPGVLSELQNAQAVLGSVQQLYGLIPKTPEASLQSTVDQSVAEAIDLHNQAYRYAAVVDPEAEQVKAQALNASPQGAARLTAQSSGVMIHVMDQVLRTNAAMLKLQGEQLALSNRREKLSSAQFLTQYGALGTAFKGLRSNYDLPSLSP